VTDDGRVWYADYGRGFIGLYDPAGQAFREWALPSGNKARPYGMASDGANVWVVETGVSPNQFVAFDTRVERFSSVTPIPSGGGSVRHMNYHAGNVWFGTDRGTIGRAEVQSD
jgi:virginiamycin B lyase